MAWLLCIGRRLERLEGWGIYILQVNLTKHFSNGMMTMGIPLTFIHAFFAAATNKLSNKHHRH